MPLLAKRSTKSGPEAWLLVAVLAQAILWGVVVARLASGPSGVLLSHRDFDLSSCGEPDWPPLSDETSYALVASGLQADDYPVGTASWRGGRFVWTSSWEYGTGRQFLSLTWLLDDHSGALSPIRMRLGSRSVVALSSGVAVVEADDTGPTQVVLFGKGLSRRATFRLPLAGREKRETAIAPDGGGGLVVAWRDGNRFRLLLLDQYLVPTGRRLAVTPNHPVREVSVTRGRLTCLVFHPRWPDSTLAIEPGLRIHEPGAWERARARSGILPEVLVAVLVLDLVLLAWVIRADGLARRLRRGRAGETLWVGKVSAPSGWDESVLLLRTEAGETVQVDASHARLYGLDISDPLEGEHVVVGEHVAPRGGAYRAGLTEIGGRMVIVRGDLAQARQRARKIRTSALKRAVALSWVSGIVPLFLGLLA